MKPVVFAGGGTGGHLYPALALAEALREAYPALSVHFVGTPDRIEAERVPMAGYPFHPIPVIGIPRKPSPELLRCGALLVSAVGKARRLLREIGPGAVVGTGGYVSAPALLAARLERVPFLIQEQNANPGLANRWLAHGAAEVFTAWPEADACFGGSTRCLGNPVRPAFGTLDRETAQARLGFPAAAHLLLVTGGSLGARSLNRAFLAALPRVLAHGDWAVLHVAGAADFAEVERQTAELPGDRYRAVPYSEDMPAAIVGCDLAVSRAGASTLAELTAAGKPMVLVPYPHGGGDQPINAAATARAGACRVVPDDAALGERLTEALLPLLEDANERDRMAAASRAMGKPGALGAIAERIMAYLE